MAELRRTAENALDTLGTIHGREEGRDAVHLAVYSVTAGQRLLPGEHVAVRDGVAISVHPGEGPGIVDPFLTSRLEKGQRFWLVLYPKTVHSLRHVWSHPAFTDEPMVPAPVAGDEDVAYLIVCADDLGLSYERFMAETDAWVDGGDYYVGGSEAEGYTLNVEKFWPCWERVTGRTAPAGRRQSFISCSC